MKDGSAMQSVQAGVFVSIGLMPTVPEELREWQPLLIILGSLTLLRLMVKELR